MANERENVLVARCRRTRSAIKYVSLLHGRPDPHNAGRECIHPRLVKRMTGMIIIQLAFCWETEKGLAMELNPGYGKERLSKGENGSIRLRWSGAGIRCGVTSRPTSGKAQATGTICSLISIQEARWRNFHKALQRERLGRIRLEVP